MMLIKDESISPITFNHKDELNRKYNDPQRKWTDLHAFIRQHSQ